MMHIPSFPSRISPSPHPTRPTRTAAVRVLWILSIATLLTSCKLFRKNADELNSDPTPTPVSEGTTAPQNIFLEGEVRFFDRQYDCVVVEYKRGPIPTSGTPLAVLRNNRIIGRLRASDLAGGRKGIADVIEGQVAPGDIVRLLPQAP